MTCVRLLAPLAPPGLLLKVGTGGQEGGIGAVLALLGGADLAVLTWTIDLKQEPNISYVRPGNQRADNPLLFGRYRGVCWIVGMLVCQIINNQLAFLQ